MKTGNPYLDNKTIGRILGVKGVTFIIGMNEQYINVNKCNIKTNF